MFRAFSGRDFGDLSGIHLHGHRVILADAGDSPEVTGAHPYVLVIASEADALTLRYFACFYAGKHGFRGSGCGAAPGYRKPLRRVASKRTERRLPREDVETTVARLS